VNSGRKAAVYDLSKSDCLVIIGVLDDDSRWTEALDLEDCTIGQDCCTAGTEQDRMVLEAWIVPSPWFTCNDIDTSDARELCGATDEQILNSSVQEYCGWTIRHLGNNTIDDITTSWNE
jgi:hypothetical protein